MIFTKLWKKIKCTFWPQYDEIQRCLERYEQILKDMSIRVHDIQDRTYDTSVQQRLERIEQVQKDMSIRVHDIQDRTYDATAQSRNQAYQITNEIKLQALRRRVKAGNKIKVVFLNSFLEKFEIASVYWEMEKSSLFDPVVLVIGEEFRFVNHPDLYERAEQAYNKLKEKGYCTIFAYEHSGNSVSLWDLQPDIVIYNDPQLAQYTEYTNYYVNANWITCYVPYFMPVVRNDAYHYHCPNINSAWKVFCPTKQYYNDFITRQDKTASQFYTFNGYNAVFTGYPKLDAYVTPSSSVTLKIENSNPIVIIAPHGNIRYDVNIATFHLYYDKLIGLLERYPNVNFVFKPHPILKRRLQSMVERGEDAPMTPSEYEEYIERWCSFPNGFYVYDGEYIDLFKRSSLMITDSGSFINEYLPSGHPCIYLLNPENEKEMDNFTNSAKKILDTYYCCENWEDAERSFVNIIIHQKDPKCHDRQKMAESELNLVGHAGKKIVEHITQCVIY